MTAKLSTPAQLADTIKAYWEKRGHVVQVELSPSGWPILSTMRNGLPDNFKPTLTNLKGLVPK